MQCIQEHSAWEEYFLNVDTIAAVHYSYENVSHNGEREYAILRRLIAVRGEGRLLAEYV